MPFDNPNYIPNYGESYASFFLQDEEDLDQALAQKRNEFLDVYSLYRRTGLSWVKDELLRKAYELSILDPHFTFYL